MNPLVASILANPSAHQVDRAKKMSDSVDVHVSNIAKKLEQSKNSVLGPRDEALLRGYGTGKRQAD